MATIYKITSEKGEKVYVGSTTTSLRARLVRHQASTSVCRSKVLFEEYGVESCVIEKLEDVKIEEKVEKERYWIEFYGDKAVNRLIPGRTSAELYREHREERIAQIRTYYYNKREDILEYWKGYREKNKDTLLPKKRTVIHCTCGLTTTKTNYARHLKSKAHLSKVETLPQME
jgi:hypothetical protein